MNNLNAWLITAALTCGHRRMDIRTSGTAGPIIQGDLRRTDITADAAIAGRDAVLVLEGALSVEVISALLSQGDRSAWR